VILLTVGTQLPFDRLVQIMDEIAPKISEPIFAQVGKGEYIPKNFEYCRMAPPDEMAERFGSASRIVSHAGTGSLLTARRYRKPIILFPRRASLGEHRNDHQLATCQQMNGAPGLSVAYDEAELWNTLRSGSDLVADEPASLPAGSMLGRGIADYIRRIDNEEN